MLLHALSSCCLQSYPPQLKKEQSEQGKYFYFQIFPAFWLVIQSQITENPICSLRRVQ